MLNGLPAGHPVRWRFLRARVLAAIWLGWFVSSPAIQAAGTNESLKTIVFFGDSLTAGYGLDDPASESYPAIVEQKIVASHLPYRVVNAGLSGETSAGGVRRADWVLRQSVDLFVLALGANDGLRGIDPAVTKANLQAIVDRVHARHPAAKVLLVGMMMPTSMGEDYTRSFAAIFPELAKANRLPLVPFLLAGVGGNESLNQADHIHPTARGHAILADNVWRVLGPLL